MPARAAGILLAGLVIGLFAVVLAPEGHPPAQPRPSYRPQRLKVPAQARSRFLAAIGGGALAFATWGLFAGLAGRFLAGPLHHPSPALAGAAIFLTFGGVVVVQIATANWPSHRLLAAGIPTILAGLGVLVLSAWTSPPSLALFLLGGLLASLGAAAIYRTSLRVVIETSDADDRAGALATFFVAGYAAISLPVPRGGPDPHRPGPNDRHPSSAGGPRSRRRFRRLLRTEGSRETAGTFCALMVLTRRRERLVGGIGPHGFYLVDQIEARSNVRVWSGCEARSLEGSRSSKPW